MAITAKELAKILNISPASVSIALNGRKGISDEKRKMILEAADSYGLVKENRRQGASSVINLVIFRKHGMILGDTPFFSSVIEAVSATVAKSGYSLQVSYFYSSQDHKEQVSSIVSSGCAGILLLATEMQESDFASFSSLDIPIVVLDNFFESALVDSVMINNAQGAYLATRHILGCGHRRLGHLCSSVDIRNFRERRYGFESAVYNSPYKDECSYETVKIGPTHDLAYRDMCEYLKNAENIPSAFFADNDIIAVSCMRALKEFGYKIPEDVSLVGFDDEPFTYVTSPKLTTVNVPKNQYGELAAKALLDRIEGKNSDTPCVKICINTSLVVRNTVSSKK